MNSTFAPLRLMMYAASLPLYRVLSGTTAAPARWMPNSVTGHSHTFGAQIATRSPGPTPAAINAFAVARASSATWANVSRTGGSTLRSTIASWSPTRSTARARRPGTVRFSESNPSIAVALTSTPSTPDGPQI